jgi:general secretion pathway protein L
MTDQVTLRLSEVQLSADTVVDWLLHNQNFELVSSGTAELQHAYQQISEYREQFSVRVIVPGQAVLLNSVTIPSKQTRKIKQALPFMIEEWIAEDIEHVHLAIPQPLYQHLGQTPVAVVAHTLLINWLDQLHSHNLSPLEITPDLLCLPQYNDSITLVLDDELILLRQQPYSGLSVNVSDTSWLLDQLANGEYGYSDELRIRVLYCEAKSGQQAVTLSDSIKAQLGDDCSLELMPYQESISELLATTAIDQNNSGINLLQGGYSTKPAATNSWLEWRLAVTVAGIGLSLYVLLNLAGGWYFKDQAEQLDQQAVAMYRQIFPNERRVISPKKQMQNHLRVLNNNNQSNFLELLGNTAVWLNSTDDKLKNLLVQQLRFDSQRGDLQFQVEANSIDQLDQLKQLLTQAGLQVVINSATEQDDRVLGRFVVSGG